MVIFFEPYLQMSTKWCYLIFSIPHIVTSHGIRNNNFPQSLRINYKVPKNKLIDKNFTNNKESDDSLNYEVVCDYIDFSMLFDGYKKT